MAGRRLSYIREAARDTLRDEFVEGVDLEWEDDELNRIIQRTLGEVEIRSPYEVITNHFDALSTVATQISATGTNLEVASDDDFPTDYPFYIVIEDEVLKVTALASADNFTVTRAQKDSTGAIHAVGKDVGLLIVTTEDFKYIDIGDIADVIRVLFAEYRVARPPRNPIEERNVSVFGSRLTLDIDFLPEDDEEVTLWLHKRHTLSDADSTLNAQQEQVLIQGVVARAAMNRGRELHNALATGGVNVGQKMTNWGKDQLVLYRQMLQSISTGIPNKRRPRGVLSSGS